MLRSLWSGTVAFGLVNIPIKLYTAVRDQSVHLHMMSPDGSCRLHRKLYCPNTGKEYDFSQTTRGFEVAPNQYVILGKDEVRNLKPEKGDTLEIIQFVLAEEIDPIFFEKAYYLGPAKGGDRAYRLLKDTLEKIERVALGRFVLRSKEHLVVLRHYGEAICVHTLNYADEVLSVKEIPGIGKSAKKVPKPSAQEIKLATELVKNMSQPFEPSRFHDRYKEQVLDLTRKKKAGEVLSAGGKKEGTPAPVLDLMKALQKSLNHKSSAKAAGKSRSKASKKKKKAS